jgi:hypothetical protein
MSNERREPPRSGSNPDDIPSGAGQGDKGGEDDTSSGGAPQAPRE